MVTFGVRQPTVGVVRQGGYIAALERVPACTLSDWKDSECRAVDFGRVLLGYWKDSECRAVDVVEYSKVIGKTLSVW